MKRMFGIIATATMYFLTASAHAEGIVTYDPASVQEAIAQTAKQLQQYQTQLQQLQNQIQNTVNPAKFVWDDANTTINNVLATVNTLNSYQSQAGSMAAYLSKYSNASQYQTSSCIGTGGCTSAQIQQLTASRYTGSDSQKIANDNMLINIHAQQQQLQTDANNLATLQQNAQGSTGQMQALQAANQFASNQAVQLMHIRSLMVAQHTAEATRAETIVDREAQEQVAHDAFIGTQPTTSQPYNILSYTGASR
jgi:P-type conjugative transfer protein TrbJ